MAKQITIQKELIKKGMKYVKSSIKRSPNQKILENIKIVIRDGKVTITGTDLETTLIVEFSVEDKKADMTLLFHPDDVLSFIDAVDSESLVIALNDAKTKMTVEAGFDILSFPNFLNVDEYPTITEDIPDATSFKMALPDLQEGIAYCKHISMKNEREIIKGICFHVYGENKLRMISTDAWVMNMYKADITIQDDLPEYKPVIFPGSLYNIAKINGNDNVDIKFNRSKMVISYGNETFRIANIYRMIEGSYPNYEAIIPNIDKDHIKTTVSVSELERALKKINPVVGKTKNDITLIYDENGITMTAADKDEGKSGFVKINVEQSQVKEEVKRSHDYTTFSRLLSGMNEDNVEIYVNPVNAESIVYMKGKDDNTKFNGIITCLKS